MSEAEPQPGGPAPVSNGPYAGLDDTDALVAVICDLSLARSQADIARICTRASRQLLAADGVSFVLRDGDQCRLLDEEAIAPPGEGGPKTLDDSIAGWVMRQRESAVVPDVTDDPRIPPDAYRDTFVCSLAMVPVRREAPLAALGVYWSTPREVAPDRLAMLQTVANAAALALAKVEVETQRENARHAQMELDHRLKNILAVIHAIAHQTMRRAANLDEFAHAFTGRLQSLAAAQTLVSRAGAEGADLATLVRQQLVNGGDDPRIAIRGPEVHLQADDAYHCGLALHELDSNARKFGALSRPEGRLTVTWAVHSENGRRKLVLDWQERGGPEVTPPSRRGFGTTLLSHAFAAGGGVESRYDPEGVSCTVTIDLGG